ncbi:MAG: hypothetical protein EPN21_18125 [Methylococcaceae bacterium]|nr:MAG: hypothetical protein EPN21_18125 [Methylococcaceae bacterium]
MEPADNQDSHTWVRAYFKRMLLEPERASQVLISIDDLSQARQDLHQCRDTAGIDAWMARYAHREAQLRCRNAMYQRKCSQGLQRLSLKKSLYQDLAALAAEQGYTINQAVAYLLSLHGNQRAAVLQPEPPPARPVVVAPAPATDAADAADDEAYRDQMILWALCRSTGRKDEE